MHHSQKTRAYTLAEMVVVIVILSILSLVAFLSYFSYSVKSRDGQRLLDLNNMSKALDLTYETAIILPEPTKGISVTFS